MAYDVTLVQVTTNEGGFSVGGVQMGFPAAFHTILYSQWVCSPPDGPLGSSSLGPFFNVPFLLNPNSGVISATGVSGVSLVDILNGTFAQPAHGVRHHMLVSLSTAAQIVQLYVDDQPVPVAATWSSNMPMPNPSSGGTDWAFQVDGSTSGLFPGVGDIWCANLAGDTFVDLSAVANRRKFINADLTPVDLGTNGAGPFGTPPQIYLSVRSGGVPSDILTNRGTGGTNFNPDTTSVLSFQASGVCTLPIPPATPPPGGGVGLAMDDLLVTATVPPDTRIFLEWSDDRGHSYGIPVGQDIGQPGAYLTSLQWQRLSFGRDRVFRLTWSVPVATALQGAWIEVNPAQT